MLLNGHAVICPPFFVFCLPHPPASWKILLASGLSIFVFELFAVPCITKRIGVGTSHRLASAAMVPVYLVFPDLSRLHDTAPKLVAAVVCMLFASHACSNAVSRFLYLVRASPRIPA